MPPEGATSFSGIETDKLLFIEVYAGTARLWKAVRDKGFQIMPVDRSADRSNKVHIAIYDLAVPSQCQAQLSFIDEHKDYTCWIHFAPACGTASKARERALPGLEKQGYKIPQPLRSEQYPLGVPGLSSWDKEKVELANQMYDSTSIIIRFAVARNIQCSIENPTNSLFWLVPCIAMLLRDVGGFKCLGSAGPPC